MTALVAAPERHTGATLEVDLSAVAANTQLFARRVTGELMAVVKADGFGHGAADVARTALAHGATRLGVTSIEEALDLRAHGLAAPVLSWLNPVDADFSGALRAGVELAVPSRDHLDAVLRAVAGQGWACAADGTRPVSVHLHLDTGMARDGAAPGEWPGLCRAARRAERQGLLRVVGVMGHLGCADVPASAAGQANAPGRTRFAWGVEVARSCGLRPVDRHLAATAASLTDPLSHHTMSRVGAGLVGIDLSRTTTLRPALALSAPLVSVRRVPAGTPVGYGETWRAPRATTLGLVPVGYADGLPRASSGRAEVLVRGRRRPLVGRHSMDMTVVDLGDDHAEPGDLVTVFGPGRAGEPTVAEWAAWSGTIEHEVVTGLGARLHRSVTAAALPQARRGPVGVVR